MANPCLAHNLHQADIRSIPRDAVQRQTLRKQISAAHAILVNGMAAGQPARTSIHRHVPGILQ
jgi:hypothetical protein